MKKSRAFQFIYLFQLAFILLLFSKGSSVAAQTGKRGLGMSTSTSTGVWYENILNTHNNWYYTWGTTIPSAQEINMPANSEFVPMFWGAGNVNSSNINKLIALKNQGKIKYILGFNEPDLTEEANMTVEQALSLWPQLESIGLPLVSPATSYPSLDPNSWFVRFMDGAIAQGRRIDYIAVHLYIGSNTGNYIKVLQEIYAKYQKPIWITEFAVRDDNTGGIPANNIYTQEMILSFMEDLLPQLEALDCIYRYAWFNPSPTMAGLWPCALFNSNGTLSILGNYYKTIKTGAYSIHEAESAVISGATVANSNSGYTSTGYVDYINNSNDNIQWVVNVPSAGTYSMQFKYALNTGNRPLQIKVNGNIVSASLDFMSTGSWTTWKYTNKITMQLAKGNNTVKATAIGMNGGNIDHLLLEKLSNLPPVVSITSPAQGATFDTPAVITIKANAVDPDGTVSKVEFYNDNQLLGTDTTSPYSYSWTTSSVGTHQITAKAYDNNNLSTISQAISVKVENTEVDSNIALGKSIVASSIQGTSYAAGKANDDNFTSRWSSASSDPQWIKIDLGAINAINKVVLNWQNASGKNYTLEVSDDINFTTKTTVANVVNGPSGEHIATFDLSNVLGRYIRMYGTARNTKYGYSLYEFEVYGSILKSTSLIEKSTDSSLKVYSENTGNVVIDLGYESLKGQLRIFNVLGNLISQILLEGNEKIVSVNLSNHSSGIYFVQIESNGENRIHKFLKH